MSSQNEELKSIIINSTIWNLPERYTNLEHIGNGSYGYVCSALDSKIDRSVAIKKLSIPFATKEHAKRVYREIKLLKHAKHYNLIALLNVISYAEKPEDLKEIYLVTNFNGKSLNDIIKTEQLKEDQIIFFTYQILRALKYLHSANIMHRDLKPANITINADDELRLIDFGMSRDEPSNDSLTYYVVSRWYRAPEIILQPSDYTKKIDMWSLGCILAEMYLKTPIFPANSPIELIGRILDVTGYPSERYLARLNQGFMTPFASRINKKKINFMQYFEINNHKVIDMLEKLLELDPSERIDCEQALKHDYVAKYHLEEDEPVSEPFDGFHEENGMTLNDWKKQVFEEIKIFQEPDERILNIVYKNEYN